MKSLDEISGHVLDISIRLHRALGPGMLESVYETVLAAKLLELGYRVERQKAVPIVFEGHSFDNAFRIDLLIEGSVLVEIKSADRLTCRSLQTTAHLSQADRPAVRPPDKFWRRYAEGGIPEGRQ